MNVKEFGATPAYPFPVPHGSGSPTGLTKREAFAMAAMQGLIARGARNVAATAVSHADELLVKLSKEPTA